MNHLITCQKTIRIWKMHLSKSPRCQQDQMTVSMTKVIWIFKISLFMMIFRRNHLSTRQRDLETVSMTKRNRIIQRTTEHASTYCNFFGMQFQLVGDWILCVCVLAASKIYHNYIHHTDRMESYIIWIDHFILFVFYC